MISVHNDYVEKSVLQGKNSKGGQAIITLICCQEVVGIHYGWLWRGWKLLKYWLRNMQKNPYWLVAWKISQNCKILEISSSKTENGTEILTMWFCDFICEFHSQYLNLVSYHHQLTDLLVSRPKFRPICQISVQKISYLKVVQTFENTTFRFVKLSAVCFLCLKLNFQHLNCVIWHLYLTY